MYTRESELFHHGIKGQKWGEKNGPPYPLKGKARRQQYKKDYEKTRESMNKKYGVNKLQEQENKEWKESGEISVSKETEEKLDAAIDKANAELRKTMVNKYGEKYVKRTENVNDVKSTAVAFGALGATVGSIYGAYKLAGFARKGITKAGKIAFNKVFK